MNILRFKRFTTSSPYWQIELFGLFLVLIQFAYIWARIKPTEKLLILHYSIPFGIDLVGLWYQLYYLPLVGGVIFLLNSVVAFVAYPKYRLQTLVVLIALLIVEFIFLTAIILLISQNT